MISEILQQPYDRTSWTKLIHEVFPNVTIYRTPERSSEKPGWIREFFQLGNVRLQDGKNLAIFEIQVDDRIELSRNRVALRELIAKKIDLGTTHGVLCVFNSSSEQYRFTFVAREAGFDDEGCLVTAETSSKRYTYVLGPGETRRTATQRFAELAANRGTVGIRNVIEAFSVDRLNKEFFRAYKSHYQSFVDHIINRTDYPAAVFGIINSSKGSFADDAFKPIRDWVKQFLGRIVFIYFIQKKGWMGCTPSSRSWKDGDPQFLRNFFDGIEDKSRFYSRYLAPLFFDALSTADRPGDLFEPTQSKIPYLNGGLFEEANEKTKLIDFPELLFKDLFDFLSAYNFTIDENDPEDHEVGIDPEMLGHIFENLLEENKDKGAYYTPKPVVQFMCQQSLLLYLQRHFGERSDLEALVREKNPGLNSKSNWIRSNAATIEELLDRLTVCDPAIGSGAFPIGMLNEIFWIKLALDWTLNDSKKYSEVKRKIVENSIHGVDIDAGAVEIAKLRCWLAIVVDDVEPTPLPNLDFKIYCANSLVEYMRGEPVDFFRHKLLDRESEKHIGALADAKAALFKAVRKQDKRTAKITLYRALVEIGRLEFVWLKNNAGIAASEERIRQLDEGLTELDGFSTELSGASRRLVKDQDTLLGRIIRWFQHPEQPTFGWRLHFADVFRAGGFDIVIANPPYVRHEKLDAGVKSRFGVLYPELSRRSDLLCYFFILGERLLKKGGVAVSIASNSWMDVGFGGQLQFEILRKTQLIELVDTSAERIFENANINPVISFQRKETSEGSFKTKFTRLDAAFSKAVYNDSLKRVLQTSKTQLLSIGSGRKGLYEGGKWGGVFFKAPEVYFDVIEKMGVHSKLLGELSRVEFGLKTGANRFFHVTLLGRSRNSMTIQTECGQVFELPDSVTASPCLISSKEMRRPLILSKDLSQHALFIPKEACVDPLVAKYIAWGEAQGFHDRPSTKSRKPWYSLPRPEFARIAFASAYDKRVLIGIVEEESQIVIDKRFYCIYPNEGVDPVLLAALLWSSFSVLCREILGRTNFGDGLLEVVVGEAKEIPLPILLSDSLKKDIKEEFLLQSQLPMDSFYNEVKANRRDRLDSLFLKACGFKDEDKIGDLVKTIQLETAKIMWNRIAKSGKSSESKQSFVEFWD